MTDKATIPPATHSDRKTTNKESGCLLGAFSSSSLAYLYYKWKTKTRGNRGTDEGAEKGSVMPMGIRTWVKNVTLCSQPNWMPVAGRSHLLSIAHLNNLNSTNTRWMVTLEIIEDELIKCESNSHTFEDGIAQVHLGAPVQSFLLCRRWYTYERDKLCAVSRLL